MDEHFNTEVTKIRRFKTGSDYTCRLKGDRNERPTNAQEKPLASETCLTLSMFILGIYRTGYGKFLFYCFKEEILW